MGTKTKSRILIWALGVGVMVVFAASAFAQDEPVVEEPLPDEELQMPGTIEGTGTYFEVTDSEYLNIALASSEPVHLRLESVPQMVVMHIEAVEGATAAQITFGGFAPSTTYYKYEDDYHNEVAFTTDGSGTCTFAQDLSVPHLVFIQSQPGTIFIPGDTSVGDWDPDTRTYTLKTHVYETIQIDEDNLTLDGAGHNINGTGSGAGVYLPSTSGSVTVKNLNVQGFSYGIYLFNSSYNTLRDNGLSNNSFGILLRSSSNNNILTGNTANSNYYHGIYLSTSNYNTLTGNAINSTTWYGIFIQSSSGNILTGNTASNNFYGIYLNSSSNNQIYNNNFIGNSWQAYIYDLGSIGNVFNLAAPDGGNYWSNHTTPDNNGDGFVDVPYFFCGVRDNLPWPIPDAWLADPCPTPVGQPVTVEPVDPSTGAWMTLTFESVTVEGKSKFTTSAPGRTQGPPEGFRVGQPPTIFNISTTAIFQGSILLGINYSGISFHGPEEKLRLFHYDQSLGWVDVTYGDVDTVNKIIYGLVTSLSPFAIFEPANQPPVADAGDNIQILSRDQVSTVVQGTASDPDGDALVYRWLEAEQVLFGWSGVGENGQAYLDLGTLPYLAIGNHILTVEVSDGRVTSCDGMTLTILNSPPELGPISAPVVPVQVDTTVAASASFSDPDTDDTHTATWDWGDGTEPSPGMVDEETGIVTGSHLYTTAGVYTVKLTVTDAAGASDEAIFEFVVVYDPGAGFVTGGGWIFSDAGSLITAPLAEGKASFGFVAKYKKGATEPTGNTEFRFQAGDFRFKSSSYDWLVIAGTKAMFKGQGSIDGMGEGFKFMLTAVDDDNSGDRFRIKIWDETTEPELVIYDNKRGEDDDAEPTIIGGGSIVIHKN